ncbi:MULTISPECIES: hypothetical protein [Halomonas]|uniref:hypothetical protein n=1 Tax=Halomonas TaxID=2745 RepID=UPI001C93CD49|nr:MULTISPECIES: hypothetical protein [Halomonas]MED5294642.1 hypothetical protein [Pseudomonadota bacterium]MBY5925195.1 hypothetical protein [Halomonas sp. DP4Y7-2]MBY5983606.1 hypothetical protein [Halomonas sp. DP5Y7-2]MBY6206426.1 hypothetical protein [Halomonas sp. DP3Y7-2]MBY6227683.1 hypothetical protein [Halomonas sp. DP3Y7-1]
MKFKFLLPLAAIAALPLTAQADARATDLARALNSEPLSMRDAMAKPGDDIINAHIASDSTEALSKARLRLQSRHVDMTNFMLNLDLSRAATK